MSVIDLGKGTSSDFVIGVGAQKKGDVSISAFNKELKDAAKSGEKVDFAKLEQVSSSERKRLDTKALQEYIRKHKDDKAHVQEIFAASSPVRDLYQKGDGFAPKENTLKRLIGPLLNFLADPSLENLKRIAGGLVSEDGNEINFTENALFTGLDRNQRLAPLATALRAIGVTGSAGEMRETLDSNPEDQKAQVGPEAVNAYVKESLDRLSHILDAEGNILQANGEVLVGPLEISGEDIRALGSEDPESLTVREGTLKWNDFAANAYKYFAGKNPGKAIDYVNTVMAIFNRKMREKLDDATDRDAKESIKAKNEEVIDIFSSRLAREFGGEGIAKAFELAFTRGAFGSESSVKAITGDAADKAGETAQQRVAQDLRDTATRKTNALSEQTDLIAQLVEDNGRYNILDLGSVIDSDPSTKASVELDYNNNKLTLATASEAYRKSAEVIARQNAVGVGEALLDTTIGDGGKARDKYIAGGDDGKSGIKSEAAAISDTARDTASNTNQDVFDLVQVAIDNIKNQSFLVDRSQADKFSKDLSKYLLEVGRIRTTKENQSAVDALTNQIFDQVEAGTINFGEIISKLKDTVSDTAEKDRIEGRLRTTLANSDIAQTFINKFINNEESEPLSNIVKAETIQDLVKSNNAIAEYLLRQAENRGFSVSSIDDIVNDPSSGLLVDASPELALIFASQDQYKNDSTRAEMAMLGLMSILKANPALLSNANTARTIVRKLFSKQVKGDDFKATALANRLAEFVNTTRLRIDGYQDPIGSGKELDLAEAARVAGTSVNRSQYLSFVAPQVSYARESVVADRLSRMINAHTTAKSRAEVYETMQSLAEHLENVAKDLDGTSFDQVQTKVTQGLSGLTLALVNNMFFPGDQFDTLGVSRDRLTGNAAPQTLMDTATRLKMVLPRLYQAPEEQKAA